ncbi:MAG: AbrB/MazE/SpoVT family DNA-binding domain-containing protein [Thermoleophilaceae bacterium]|jgi:AbrB family looped-hinge helix DNA binding protein
MTTRVGPKGQVVIPKRIRDRLGLRPGDRVSVEQQGAAVRVSKAVTVDDLIGSLPPSELDPLEVLVAERRRDRDREDKRL